jgi:hypothetical protein
MLSFTRSNLAEVNTEKKIASPCSDEKLGGIQSGGQK